MDSLLKDKIKESIQFLIDLEVEKEDKLELLTAIGLQTSRDEIWVECEMLRNELCKD
jgi:hypothetical protein